MPEAVSDLAESLTKLSPNEIVFTAGPKLGSEGAVSPDGLYVIDVAGGPPRKIAGGAGICCPSWQPVP